MSRPLKIHIGRRRIRVRSLVLGLILLGLLIAGGRVLGRSVFAWTADRVMPYQVSPLVRRVEIPCFGANQTGTDAGVPACPGVPPADGVAGDFPRNRAVGPFSPMPSVQVTGDRSTGVSSRPTPSPVQAQAGPPAVPSEEPRKPLGAYVVASLANIRRSPSVSAGKIGAALKGEIAEISDRRNGWSLLVFKDRGLTGSVRDDLFAVFDQPGN